MFTVVAFYFYLDQKDKFTVNTVILTALISFAFMMRNTSPVGWIPLLAIKVLREGSLVPFIISGLFVALPILFFCVYVDTKMYNADTWVLTGYNFLEMNILHGLSKYFGEDGPLYYLIVAIPSIFIILCPLAYFSFCTHYYYSNQPAYMTYYSVFYFIFFSLIAHKEVRFLMPLVPFVMLMTAELITKTLLKKFPFFVAFSTKLYMMVELITLATMTLNHERASLIRTDLLSRYPDMHSFYSVDVYNTPANNLLHR
jgi:phosphatidylinositol glycan class B